eukprot:4949808-Pleurochrysis_carterae.AAC.1
MNTDMCHIQLTTWLFKIVLPTLHRRCLVFHGQARGGQSGLRRAAAFLKRKLHAHDTAGTHSPRDNKLGQSD